MNKNFEKELIALINKHGMEKEFGDTPDFILAKVAIVSMMNFSAATQERDKWHGFKRADEPRHKNRKTNIPDVCKICIDRFRCSEFFKRYSDGIQLKPLKAINDETETEIPSYVKEVAEKLGEALGATVEIHRFEYPVKKRRFKKKTKKAPKEEKPTIQENETDLRKKIGEVLQELSQIGDNVKITFKDKNTGTERMLTPIIQNENEQK